MKKIILFLLLLSPFLISSGYATIIIPGVSTYKASGANMAGMEVSINGGSESVMWAATGPDSGGAIGTGWGLNFSRYDTWPWGGINPPRQWELYGTDIESISINAHRGTNSGLGWVLFDILFAETYTPGSELGWWLAGGVGINDVTLDNNNEVFSVSGSETGWNWTFTNPVALTNSSAVGDLFGTLTINFDSASTYTRSEPFTFFLDTDLDVRSPVPEPATMALLGLGLLGLAGIARRKKSA